MSTFTVSQRQVDELTMRLGRVEDELAEAERRERALEQRVLEYLHALTSLTEAIAGHTVRIDAAVTEARALIDAA